MYWTYRRVTGELETLNIAQRVLLREFERRWRQSHSSLATCDVYSVSWWSLSDSATFTFHYEFAMFSKYNLNNLALN